MESPANTFHNPDYHGHTFSGSLLIPHLASLSGPIFACLLGLTLGISFLISPLLGAAVTAGLAAIWWFVPRWMQTSYILIGAIVFTSAVPRGQLVPILRLNEIVLMATILLLPIGLAGRAKLERIPGLPLTAIAILVVGTSVLPTMIYLLKGFPLTIEDILSLLGPLQYPLIFWFFATVPQTEAHRHQVIQFMFLTCSVVSLIGLLQAFGLGPIVAFLNSLYPSEHTTESAAAGRVTSVLGAWNSLGTFLMFNLVIALALQNYPSKAIYRANTFIMICLALPCLLATNFYAAILGMATSFVMLKLIEPRGFRIVFMVGLLFLVAIVLLWPQINTRLEYQFSEGELLPQTIRFRVEVWQNYYIGPILESPYSGVSPTARQLGFVWAESQYIYLLFRSGVFALISHLLWVVTLLVWLARRIRSTSGLPYYLASALFTLLIVLSVMGVANPVFTYSGSIDFLWISLGLATRQGGY
jgi:hypothetical protein